MSERFQDMFSRILLHLKTSLIFFFELKIFCYCSENENDCKIWGSSIKV